ncbi:Holliday junction resolvase RuvX [Metallumcola ferriviriculae]|uniref:Putative pre-16S rRNA nuclease n=1 Tax=Metallumcola ferriviriculae TaxID=3039180 RepID=A0AAU0USC1_9FIRM|nr:Holliday junction resolvase RuvX [Desulfitibacteraceae bacterium MK1]
MRLMGLDVGDKTIGVAVSDLLGLTAQGVETVRRDEKIDYWQRLAALCSQYEVEKIVVGMPRNMNGTYGPRAEKTEEFIEQLQDKIPLSVETWDERLSTVAAQRTLLDADLSRKKRKKVIDKMAAVFILQGYLDSKQ